MKMLAIFLFVYCINVVNAIGQITSPEKILVANGQMPSLVTDRKGMVHLVYGNGDSIFYARFIAGRYVGAFSKPALLGVVPGVFTFATRGPQIAAGSNGLVVTVCTAAGNVYAFSKPWNGKWTQAKQINDVAGAAKEGFNALAADGNRAVAIWLDIRIHHKNQLFIAQSTDGGLTWSKNKLLYASPDSSICECCKPSVVMKDEHIYAMFRNWLKGNRDLYLIESVNGGRSFGKAQKLGNGSWKLNACPMDGGGLATGASGSVYTVWRRDSVIYAAMPGNREKAIGVGKSCTVTVSGKRPVYVWAEKGAITVVDATGQKKVVGSGATPVIRSLNNGKVICVWEDEKRIEAVVMDVSPE